MWCFDAGAFIAKWRASTLKERSASQEHFIDLCRLLDEPTPAEADPSVHRIPPGNVDNHCQDVALTA